VLPVPPLELTASTVCADGRIGEAHEQAKIVGHALSFGRHDHLVRDATPWARVRGPAVCRISEMVTSSAAKQSRAAASSVKHSERALAIRMLALNTSKPSVRAAARAAAIERHPHAKGNPAP